MERTQNLESILASWGIGAIADWRAIQGNVAKIICSDGSEYVFKRLVDGKDWTIRRLAFEHEILTHAARGGLSVAIPLLSDKGTPYAVDSDSVYRLSAWLPNAPAPLRTEEERSLMLKNFGEAIGRFHLALASYEDEGILEKTWKTDLKTRVIDQALPIVTARLDPARLGVLEDLWRGIEREMALAYADLPMQLIIWDCHPANVAVDGFRVSGFIDCDHISIAPRVFDVANFLVNLHKWDLGDAQKERAWLDGIVPFLAGYESLNRLSPRERAALPHAMIGMPLMLMDYFFQAGLPDKVQREFDSFCYLIRHRREISARLEPPGPTSPRP